MKPDENIKFIDFHTHHGEGGGDTMVIRNLLAGEKVPESLSPGTYYSAGIHPWYLTKGNCDELKSALIPALEYDRVIMVGEAGFDSVRGPSTEIQYDAFIYQTQLAEKLDKPLVIHAVRLWDVLRKAKKEVNPSVQWIVHGFRGNAKLASELVSEGFMVSLGIRGILPEVIEAAGIDNILLETDDSESSIQDVYRNFVRVSGIGENEVIAIMKSNFIKLSGKQNI
jgi:TatD DNase family protein